MGIRMIAGLINGTFTGNTITNNDWLGALISGSDHVFTNNIVSNNGSGISQQAKELEQRWKPDPRWKGVERNYTGEDVIKLRGSVQIEHTLARRGAERLWKSLNQDGFIRTFGAYTGMQATNMAKAGLQALYLS